MHSFTQHLSLGFSVSITLNFASRISVDIGLKEKKRQGKELSMGLGEALHAGGQFAIIDGTRLAAEDDGGV